MKLVFEKRVFENINADKPINVFELSYFPEGGHNDEGTMIAKISVNGEVSYLSNNDIRAVMDFCRRAIERFKLEV